VHLERHREPVVMPAHSTAAVIRLQWLAVPPAPGHRAFSPGSTTTISNFSGDRSFRGHRPIYVLTTTACSVSRMLFLIGPSGPGISCPRSRTNSPAQGNAAEASLAHLERHAAHSFKIRNLKCIGEPEIGRFC
jgi:hypothetical protein